MYQNKSTTKMYQRRWNMRIGENDNNRIVCRGHNQYIHTDLFITQTQAHRKQLFTHQRR